MRALGACAFVAPPARTLKWSFFTPEQGGSEKAVLTAERTLTARCLLGIVFGQRNAIVFIAFLEHILVPECGWNLAVLFFSASLK